MVHEISDSLGGVLHLPARGQGVLLDHPATGERAVSAVPARGAPSRGMKLTYLPLPTRAKTRKPAPVCHSGVYLL